MPKVIIADDHRIFIQGIKSLLETEPDIDVVGEAENGGEVLQILERQPADVVLMDIHMPATDGMTATRQIAEKFPRVHVVMLTMDDDSRHIRQALEAGAVGYILKNTGKAELLKAISQVTQGGKYYSPEVATTFMESISNGNAPLDQVELSERETQILRLICKEMTTQEIAVRLNISTHTVDSHRKNLLSKLQARNQVGLVKYALQHGLVEE